MSMRLQWRPFHFFEYRYLSEDVVSDFGTQVSCMACGVRPKKPSFRTEDLRQGASGPAKDSGAVLFLADTEGNVCTCVGVDADPTAAEAEAPVAPLDVRFRKKVLNGWAIKMKFAADNKSSYLAVAGDDTSTSAVPADDDVGDQDGGGDRTPRYALKICKVGYDTSAGEGKGLWGALQLVQSLSLPPEYRQAALTTLSFTVWPTPAVAVGFSNGAVLLRSGPELLREGGQVALRSLREPGAAPVSALHFATGTAAREAEAANAATGLHSPSAGAAQHKLFLVTAEDRVRDGTRTESIEVGFGRDASGGSVGVVAYSVGEQQRNDTGAPLDDRGCSHGCSDVHSFTGELVVGRSDGVFFFTVEDRGGAAAFEGDKQWVQWLNGYILVASLERRSQRTGITIYDLQNKFVAFHQLLKLGQKVTGVVSVGSTAWVLSSGMQLLRLTEKKTSDKLEILLNKKLFPIAISLASDANYDPRAIIDIYRRYGDHLCKKGDFENAMTQYLHTIGHVDTSYVIMRYLNTQRISLLTVYLERLHELGHAVAEHTNLLLSCYAKLKDVEKLDAFINGEKGGLFALTASANGGDDKHTQDASVNKLDPEHSGFDVERATEMLHRSGYHDHALKLASKAGAHELYINIQLNREEPNYDDALVYISGLEPQQGLVFLKRHGRELLGCRATETTGLLMHLCQGLVGREGRQCSAKDARQDFNEHIEELLPLFVDHSDELLLFLEALRENDIKNGAKVSAVVGNPLLELYLAKWEQSNSADAVADAATWSTKIMDLLEEPDCLYDADHALVLTQMANFRKGQLLLLERLRLTELVLQAHADDGDLASQIKLCRRAGRGRPDLWSRVLRYAVESTMQERGETDDDDDEDEDERWDDVIQILELCEQGDILPPLQVLDILSTNPATPLKVVSPFLERLLTGAQDQIATDKAEIRELRSSTAGMSAEMEELRTVAKTFQANTCAFSGSPFELPVVHFMCGHSYNLSSLPEGEQECLQCSGEQRKWNDIYNSQVQAASDHEQFFKELEHAHEKGFDVIAKYFGKGVVR